MLKPRSLSLQSLDLEGLKNTRSSVLKEIETTISKVRLNRRSASLSPSRGLEAGTPGSTRVPPKAWKAQKSSTQLVPCCKCGSASGPNAGATRRHARKAQQCTTAVCAEEGMRCGRSLRGVSGLETAGSGGGGGKGRPGPGPRKGAHQVRHAPQRKGQERRRRKLEKAQDQAATLPWLWPGQGS